MRYVPCAIIAAACLALVGCGAILHDIREKRNIPYGAPDIDPYAREANEKTIRLEEKRCKEGDYVGVRVEELLLDGRVWASATSKKVQGRYYTVIYYKSEYDVHGKGTWYEYWYQFHDYDEDGKVDECKFYEVFKGYHYPQSDDSDDVIGLVLKATARKK